MHNRKEKIKIALDARYLGSGGGIERYINQINKCIDKNSFKLILISSKKHWLLWEMLILPFKLWRIGPDIYHATANYGIPIFSPCPKIVTIHDIIPKIDKNYFKKSRFPPISLFLYHLRMQIVLTFSNKIICTTSIVKNELLKYFYLDRNKVVIIPMGVDEKFMKGKRKGGNFILNHGGISERKNIDRLIKAYLQLKTTNELYITGNIAGYNIHHNIPRNIKFTGWLSENQLIDLVHNCKFVIYPSLSEGFGLPLLEGMASGKLVVTSNLPTLKQIGKNIPIYINPHSVNSIKKGMQKALLGISKRKVQDGIKIAKGYSWNKTVKATSEVYKQSK